MQSPQAHEVELTVNHENETMVTEPQEESAFHPEPSLEIEKAENYPNDDEEEDSKISKDEDVIENKPSRRKKYSLIALAVLLSLMLAGVIMRIVMSKSHKDNRAELSQREEAAFCERNGCLNLNCLRINKCHTDPDEAYCVDSECTNADCPITGNCAVPGRPFREKLTGQALTAQASTLCRDCPWSSSKNKHPLIHDMDKVSTWSHRAVGEHASIASFAVFVIALLTHQAPPHLISGALQAASDELRHAQMAFGRAAAANGGIGIGPTGLPESHFDFVNDLTALAKAVAQEGCIDETLSALELAQESEHENGDGKLLWEIARDEANHSRLAWSTLHWICLTDPPSCDATLESVLRPSRIATAVESRFGRRPQSSSNGINDAWQRITDHLIPSIKDQPVECPTYVPSASAVDTLAMDIIRGFCRPVMAA